MTECGQPSFARRRHLAFAVLASGLAAWVISLGSAPARLLLAPKTWIPEAALVNTSIWLLAIALPAWAALAVFDTHSGVTFPPRRWRSLGFVSVAALVVMIAGMLPPRFMMSADEIAEYAYKYHDTFIVDGQFRWTLFVVWEALSVAAEELLYRVLIQRAFEGYIGKWPALVGQAVIFQFAHTHVYGYEFTFYYGIAGLVFGFAFMRTHSLAAPWAIHFVHNLAAAAVLIIGIPLS